MLSKLDATKERCVAEKLEVRGYPTVKFFRRTLKVERNPGSDDVTTLKTLEQEEAYIKKICDKIIAPKTLVQEETTKTKSS